MYYTGRKINIFVYTHNSSNVSQSSTEKQKQMKILYAGIGSCNQLLDIASLKSVGQAGRPETQDKISMLQS